MGKISTFLLGLVFTAAVVLGSPSVGRHPQYELQTKLSQKPELLTKLAARGIAQPKDFLSDLIAQVGLTAAAVGQDIVDVQTNLTVIVAPGGEELVNEIKFILEIGGIRALEIVEPLLLMLQPLFPPPEVKRGSSSAIRLALLLENETRDLISDIIEAIETLLGVEIHELYYVIETTMIQLDELRVQLIRDIVAVAAKVGPEAVDEVEILFINFVIQIKEDFVPLWDLISQLIPFKA